MRVTLIHNASAGDDEQPSGKELLAMIHGAGHDCDYRSSKDDGWEEAALEDPGDLVAVAGGDGTIGKVAKRLIGRRIPLAVLPLGTANNISKTLGITRPIQQLIERWDSGWRVKFDLGVASGPWGETTFIEGIGIGLFTGLMSKLDARDNLALAHLESPEEKLNGVLRMLHERSRSFPALKLNATLDGHDISGEYLLLEALNIKYVGPNLRLAPAARCGDGYLDFVLLTEAERDQFSKYLAGELEGRGESPRLTVRRGRHLQFQWEGFGIRIDDKVWPGTEPFPLVPATIDVRVDRHALEFLVA